MTRILLLYIFLFVCVGLYAQRNVTSKLRIIQNDDVQIIFNGVSDFENGVVLQDWTILNVTFTDTLDDGSASATNGWQLFVRAGDNRIWSTSGATSLELSTVEMEVFYNGSTQGTYPLTSTDQEIASGTGKINVDKDITLTYNCGTKAANRIEGFTESYFIVNLIFTLQPDPLP